MARIHRIFKKGLSDLDNHDGVITHLKPDILECEVKWSLGRITINRASGGEGTPAEFFQSLKDDAVKVLNSMCHHGLNDLNKFEEIVKDWEAWRVAVHGVTKSWTGLID